MTRNDKLLVAGIPQIGDLPAFRVIGAPVRRIAGARVDPASHAPGQSGGTLVVGQGDRPQTIALQLHDRQWLAGVILPGFVGIASIADGAVIGLNYQPLWESPRPAHEAMFRHWTALMSNGEAAPVELEHTADRIRLDKHVNPALGILAAYAYERAGNLRGIDSMIGYFAEIGQPVPFDIAMLSTYRLRRRARQVTFADPVRHEDRTFDGCVIAGTFPLMNRGWSMLDSKGAGLHRQLPSLRAGLQPSLWTLFDAAHGERLAALIEDNEL